MPNATEPGIAPRKALAKLLSCLSAAIVAAASMSSADAGSRAGGDDELRLGYFANITHAQALLGVQSGDFQQAIGPVKLVPRVFNAGPSLIEALFAGEIDIGYVGPSPALNAYAQSRGEGIRVIAGASANGVVIVARKGSGIVSLADLKGRRIATPQLGNTQDVSARHYVKTVLKQPDTDNVIPVPNAEQASMMARGEIDAAWAVEPWGARLVAEAQGTIIAEEKDLWPDKRFVLTLVVVTPEFLAKRPEVVRKLLESHCDLTDRLIKDRAGQVPKIAEALKAITGKDISQAIVSDAISRVEFTTEPLADSLQTFSRWAYEIGSARNLQNTRKLTDTTLLDEVRSRASTPSDDAPGPK